MPPGIMTDTQMPSFVVSKKHGARAMILEIEKKASVSKASFPVRAVV